MEYDAEIRQVRLNYERALDEVLSRQSEFYNQLRYNLGARLDKRNDLTWNEIQVCLESRMTELERFRDKRPISAAELTLAHIKHLIAEALETPDIDWEEIKDRILKLRNSLECAKSVQLSLSTIIRPQSDTHLTEPLSWNVILDVVSMLKQAKSQLTQEHDELRKKVTELESYRRSLSQIITENHSNLLWPEIISQVRSFVNEINVLRNQSVQLKIDIQEYVKERDTLLKMNASLQDDNKNLREKISSMQDDAQQATHLLCKNHFNPISKNKYYIHCPRCDAPNEKTRGCCDQCGMEFDEKENQ